MEFIKIKEIRESKRAFRPDKVSKEKIYKILDAARWSPSASNMQPARFLVLDTDESIQRIKPGLAEGNYWALKAPVIIVVFSKPELDYQSDKIKYYTFDSGQAVMSLIYAAVDNGLMAHPMAGFNGEKIKEIFSIPSEMDVIVVIAIGYKGDINTLDEVTRKKDMKERVRKSLSEIAFLNDLNNPFGIERGEPERYFETEIDIRFNDIDLIGHVNNATFLTYFEEARWKFFAGIFGKENITKLNFIIASINIDYENPIFPLDEPVVRMWVSDIGRTSFRFNYKIVSKDNSKVFAGGSSVQVFYDYAENKPIKVPQEFIERAAPYTERFQ
ncbi:MAG: nitroreductase family protein [Deltaproteobacteria bacterium]|nr:nitroreductase family protein [Deltaproteobacteria bacterium]